MIVDSSDEGLPLGALSGDDQAETTAVKGDEVTLDCRLKMVRQLFGERSFGRAAYESEVDLTLPNSEKADRIHLTRRLTFLPEDNGKSRDGFLLVFSSMGRACTYEIGCLYNTDAEMMLVYEEDVDIQVPNQRTLTNYRIPTDEWRASSVLDFLDSALIRFQDLKRVRLDAPVPPMPGFTRGR